MKMNNPDPNFPKSFNGVWWLDGDGSETYLSWAGSGYDAKRRRITAPIYGSQVWASGGGPTGFGSLSGARQSCCVYEVWMDETFSKG